MGAKNRRVHAMNPQDIVRIKFPFFGGNIVYKGHQAIVFRKGRYSRSQGLLPKSDCGLVLWFAVPQPGLKKLARLVTFNSPGVDGTYGTRPEGRTFWHRFALLPIDQMDRGGKEE